MIKDNTMLPVRWENLIVERPKRLDIYKIMTLDVPIDRFFLDQRTSYLANRFVEGSSFTIELLTNEYNAKVDIRAYLRRFLHDETEEYGIIYTPEMMSEGVYDGVIVADAGLEGSGIIDTRLYIVDNSIDYSFSYIEQFYTVVPKTGNKTIISIDVRSISPTHRIVYDRYGNIVSRIRNFPQFHIKIEYYE